MQVIQGLRSKAHVQPDDLGDSGRMSYHLSVDQRLLGRNVEIPAMALRHIPDNSLREASESERPPAMML